MVKATSANVPDVSNTDPGYWERVLAAYGLSMDCGTPSRSGFVKGPEVVLFSDLEGKDKNEIGI